MSGGIQQETEKIGLLLFLCPSVERKEAHLWQPPVSSRCISAKAAPRAGPSAILSTMWPTQTRRTAAGTADAEFLLAKRQYIAATGRVRGADDVIAYQVRQSFKPGEIAPEEANRLGVKFAKRSVIVHYRC